MTVKLFVMTDTQEDFDLMTYNSEIVELKGERLEDIEQLDMYSRVEIWDCRELSKQIEEQGIEVIVNPL